jgi:HEAT repeat protein
VTRGLDVLIVLAVLASDARAQRCARASEIADTSRVVKLLKTALESDSAASNGAGRELRALDSSAVLALMAVLCTAAPHRRPVYAAGQVLSTIGRPGITALATAIGDLDSTVSQNAAAALGFLNFEQRHDPTPELLPLVSDPPTAPGLQGDTHDHQHASRDLLADIEHEKDAA